MKKGGIKLKKIGVDKTFVDGQEVKSDEHFIISAEKQKFIILYEKFISAIADVGYTDIGVFFALCFRLENGSNSFVSNGKLIDDVATKLGISSNTVRNSLTALKKGGLLHQDKQYKRSYTVNPHFAWFGSQNEKHKVASFILKQTAEGSGINTSVKVKGVKMTITRTNEEVEKSFKDE